MSDRYSRLEHNPDSIMGSGQKRRDVVYHPNQYSLPQRFLNNNELTKEECTEIATMMNQQAEQYRELGYPEAWIKPDTGTSDASHEEFFKDRIKETIQKWRCDSISAVYMSDTTLRFICGGRDTEKNQNHLRIFDFRDKSWKQLYTNTNNGNFVVVGVTVFYLRLLTDNGIEMVEYDCQALKEVSRWKQPHGFEISQVCICEDHHGSVYNATTPQEFKDQAIIGYMKQGGSWVFNRTTSWSSSPLFTFNGYNLSLWCFYKGKRGDLLLWNQWSDRDKCYYEMKKDGDQFNLGAKRSVFNSEFEYL